jgi:N-carbamoyl-L-amino-acid hydrolase
MDPQRLQISRQKLFSKLDKLSSIGATPEGGVRRLALSDEDKLGRDQIVSWMTDLDLQVRIDQIGNIFGIRQGIEDIAPVMTGSHIDTVINGGNLDGNLGVIAGLEIAHALNCASIRTQRPFIIGVFTNEEGARFHPDMMGSLVYAGGFTLEEALNCKDRQSIELGAELKRIGYNGDMQCGSIIPHAFIELHIEQGPVLEQENITIGVVENLQGISWTEIEIRGQANHAGTTPMHLRKDAGYCAAKINTFVHDMALEFGGGQVATVGTTEIKPSVINVVPGFTKLTVDLRNADNDLLIKAEKKLDQLLKSLEDTEGVTITSQRLARFNPVVFDPTIVETIEKNADMMALTHRRMTSGAGHDAQMMARICPTAMIFIPSINGVSHNPAEATHPEDVLSGVNLLLQTALELLQN